MRLVWTDPAANDLDIIESYIAADDPVAAIDVVLRIMEKVEFILTSNPCAGRPGCRQGTRELVISGLPYIAVYRESIRCVEVLRVLHDAQQWPPVSRR